MIIKKNRKTLIANMKKEPRLGFSLLELSISLLVIGLLMTAVVKGSDLISQARLTAARELTINSPILKINDLKVWYETTLSTSFVSSEVKDGGAISTWYDSSGNNPINPTTLTQSTSGYQPLYSATAINNLPAIKFDGIDDFLSNAALNFPYNNYSVFVVFIPVTNAATTAIVSISIGSNSGMELQTLTSQKIRTLHRFPYGTSGNDDMFTSAVSQYLLKKSYIASYVRNATGNSSIVRLNGTSIMTNDPARPNFDGSVLSLFIGSRYGTTAFFDGYISEIIIYSRALNTQERQDVERYLGQKWGITVS